MNTCNAKRCKQPSRARGYCTLHYQRFKKHGSPYAKKLKFNPKLLEDYEAGIIDDYYMMGYTVQAVADYYGVGKATVERHCPSKDRPRGWLSKIDNTLKLKILNGVWK